jgi:hypothetical protein
MAAAGDGCGRRDRGARRNAEERNPVGIEAALSGIRLEVANGCLDINDLGRRLIGAAEAIIDGRYL